MKIAESLAHWGGLVKHLQKKHHKIARIETFKMFRNCSKSQNQCFVNSPENRNIICPYVVAYKPTTVILTFSHSQPQNGVAGQAIASILCTEKMMNRCTTVRQSFNGVLAKALGEYSDEADVVAYALPMMLRFRSFGLCSLMKGSPLGCRCLQPGDREKCNILFWPRFPSSHHSIAFLAHLGCAIVIFNINLAITPCRKLLNFQTFFIVWQLQLFENSDNFTILSSKLIGAYRFSYQFHFKHSQVIFWFAIHQNVIKYTRHLCVYWKYESIQNHGEILLLRLFTLKGPSKGNRGSQGTSEATKQELHHNLKRFEKCTF